MLAVSLNYVLTPALFDKVPYDPLKSFEPIALTVTTNVLLTVNPSVPAGTVEDLIALVKAKPAKYSYASGGGVGSPGHLVGEQFRLALGLDLVHVPFNGANLAVGSVVAGHTPIGFVAPTPALSLIKDGKLRALGQASTMRLQALPDVPTMAEAGYPGIECDSWGGFLVPAGTPRPIIATLNRETVKIIALPELRERLTGLGSDPIGSTPDEFALRIKTDIEKWGKVIRAAHIKL
jgi:tripartite-type tricarboxylate transporter receptor subunit TctC